MKKRGTRTRTSIKHHNKRALWTIRSICVLSIEMNFLKDEINRKRKLNETIRSQLNGGGESAESSNTIGTSKFIRNGDRKRVEEQALLMEQDKLDSERAKNISAVSHLTEKRISEVSFSTAEKKQITYAHLSNLNPKEVKDRLRNLGQPITYFGESNEQRLQRLIAMIKQNEGREGGDDEGHHSFKHKIVANDEEEAALEADDLRERQEAGGLSCCRELCRPSLIVDRYCRH